MDEDGNKLFDTDGLSFDSTLDSLMDVDFLLDASYIPPTESEMSTGINDVIDFSSCEGGHGSCQQGSSVKHLENGYIQDTDTESHQHVETNNDKGTMIIHETAGTEEGNKKTSESFKSKKNENADRSCVNQDSITFIENKMGTEDSTIEESVKDCHPICIPNEKGDNIENYVKGESEETLTKLVEENESELKNGENIEEGCENQDSFIEKQSNTENKIIEETGKDCHPISIPNVKGDSVENNIKGECEEALTILNDKKETELQNEESAETICENQDSLIENQLDMEEDTKEESVNDCHPFSIPKEKDDNIEVNMIRESEVVTVLGVEKVAELQNEESTEGSGVNQDSVELVGNQVDLKEDIIEKPVKDCHPISIANEKGDNTDENMKRESEKVVAELVDEKQEIQTDESAIETAEVGQIKDEKQSAEAGNKQHDHLVAVRKLPEKQSDEIASEIEEVSIVSMDEPDTEGSIMEGSVEAVAENVPITSIESQLHDDNDLGAVVPDDTTEKHLTSTASDEKQSSKSNSMKITKEQSSRTSESSDTVKDQSNHETVTKAKTVSSTCNKVTIGSLNLDEIKAKRMRKLAEKKSVKHKSVDSENNIGENNYDKLVNRSCGKRKVESISDENEQMPTKLLKVDSDKNTCAVTNEDTVSNITNEIFNEGEDNDNDLKSESPANLDQHINIPMSVDEDIEEAGDLLEQNITSDSNCDNESMNDTLTDFTVVDDDVNEIDDDEIITVESDAQSQSSKTNEEQNQEQDMNGEYSGDESSENDLDEIDAWLDEELSKKEKEPDEDYENELKSKRDLKPGEFLSREKIILEEKNVNPFEVLPLGWLQICHRSGMNVYLHKETRVCTVAKPYFLGPLSVRRHDIPVSAVPCLQYRKGLQKEQEEAAEKEVGLDGNDTPRPDESQPTTNGAAKETGENGQQAMPPAVLQSMDKKFMINPRELNDYCKGLFKFKTVIVKKFRTWREKRSHLVEERRNRPGLPFNNKLITVAMPDDQTIQTRKKKKEFVLNPVGKTPVCILHEYTQHVLKVQPTYEFKEIENCEKPFKSTVVIGGIQYGSGVSSGKRQAKAEAAKATLEIFMPEVAAQFKDATALVKQKEEENADLSYFENVDIEDPRVMDLCDRAALPKPYQVLVECLRRNFGLGDTNLAVHQKVINNQKTEFSLTVGKHTSKVVCRNKREGKQFASQAMLKTLHPHLKSWAAIMRLYSRHTELGFKEREEETVALTQESKEKNFEILEKLKEAMRKVRTRRDIDEKAEKKLNIQSITQPLDL